MSPLASLILAKGHDVSGSDIKESPITQRLREQGGRIVIGHHSRNVNGADIIVYSSAITQDNPEMLTARKKKLPVLKRAQLLAKLMEKHVGITVAGAHGKTTTTSMISQLLTKAGLNPTTAVGGIMSGKADHAALGAGEYFVAEVDESDGSFLYFNPKYSVITNIDFEHVDYYRDWDSILKAYQEFIAQTDPDGIIIACGDDGRLKKLLQESPCDCMTYGFLKKNHVVAENIHNQGYSSRFECIVNGKNSGTIQLPVPGRHNILNALACVCLGLKCSIDFSVIQNTLKSYRSVRRRFQRIGEKDDITVIDDYGHHPTEITAVLETARSLGKKRVVTVFQPHRYTRTKLLMDDFVKALSLSDYLIITDIYAAGESGIDGVSAQDLCERLKILESRVVYLKKESIVEHLLKITRPGDLVLTLGAGNIHQIAGDFFHRIQKDACERN